MGSMAATAVDVVAKGHLPGRAEAREGWAAKGPSDDASPHRQTSRMITQGHSVNSKRRSGSPSMHLSMTYASSCGSGAYRPVLGAVRSRV